jgi:hypothetical protein
VRIRTSVLSSSPRILEESGGDKREKEEGERTLKRALCRKLVVIAHTNQSCGGEFRARISYLGATKGGGDRSSGIQLCFTVEDWEGRLQ